MTTLENNILLLVVIIMWCKTNINTSNINKKK